MAWSDEPTDSQIGTLYRWISWHMSTPEARHAIKWLKNNATRKEVSDEIKRVHDLYYSRKLDKDSCFDSEVWEGYEYDGDMEMPEPKLIIDYGN